MGVIFDSSEIIAIERNKELLSAITAGREEEPFGISAVTISELLHGVERADSEVRRLKRQAFVEGSRKVLRLRPIKRKVDIGLVVGA